MQKVSIIVPIYNEEESIHGFISQLQKTLATLSFSFEILFIDDGSHDRSSDIIATLQSVDPRIKLIQLSRNFGHQSALLAGIHYAKGDCVITLDGDLEHPPELIPELIEHWKSGAQIVNTQRNITGSTSIFKQLSSRYFYPLFRKLSGLPLNSGMADFRLIDRTVLNAMAHMPERALFLRGMLQWVGYKQVIVPYTPSTRVAGKSKFSKKKMFSLALNGITAYSVTPLRIATILGFIFSLFSFLYLAYALLAWLFSDATIVGWTSVIGSILFLGGIQLLCLGIIGEYIGRIFQEVKGRPHYLVKKCTGFDDA